jgi:hypothetical protein
LKFGIFSSPTTTGSEINKSQYITTLKRLPHLIVCMKATITMKLLFLLTTFAAAATAFVPTAFPTATTVKELSLQATSTSPFKDELGAQMPLGFWDPMSLLGSDNVGRFNRLREVEIKHGRIAMLAVVGYLTTYAGVRLDGMQDMPAGFAAIQPSAWIDNPVAKTQVYGTILFIGLLEFCVMKDHMGRAEFPGDYRNGGLDFGWDSFDDATKKRKRGIELNNGRAAQMGILGLMVHDMMGNVDTILPLAGKVSL